MLLRGVEMKKYRGLVVLILLLAIMPLPAFASDISSATYYGVITIHNAGTATTAVSANVSGLSSPVLISGGYTNSSANNTAIRNTSGADVAFMPGYSTNPWMLFVPSIGEDSYVSNVLYTAESTGGKYCYFPGTAGMTTIDAASMEIGSDNFSLQISGQINASVSDNIIRKAGALRLYTASGNVCAELSEPTTVTNSTRDANRALYTALPRTRAGQKYTVPASTITTAGISLSKSGAPTGTGYLRVRKVSDDSLLGTLGSLDVATLDGVPTVKTFNTTPVTNTASQDLYIAFEYTGGDAGNYVLVGHSITNQISGVLAEYNGAVWSEPNAAWDATITFTYYSTPAAPQLSAAITTGEHDLELQRVGATLTLFIDGVDSDNTAAISIPDGNGDWISFENGVMPYIEYQKLYVDGTLVQYIRWKYGTTFTDDSGYGNDASPTFRTTTSDADVTASLTSFLPVQEAKAPAYSLSEQPDFITTVPSISSSFNVTPPAGTFPLASVIKSISESTSKPTPSQLPLVIIAGFVMLGCSLGASAMMKRYGSNSIFVKMAIIVGIMGVFIALGNFGIDFWLLAVFLIISIAIAFASRQVGWS